MSRAERTLGRLLGFAAPPSFGVLSVLTVTSAVGYGLVAPVLPLVVDDFSLSNTGASWLLASYAVGRVAVALPSGRVVNRYGFRPVAITCSILTGGAALVAAMVTSSFGVLVGSQLVQGMAAGVLTTAGLTAVVGLSDGGDVGRLVSVYHGMILAVMIFAPSIGGVAATFLGIAGPFWVATAAGLLGLMLSIVRIPADLLPARRHARRPSPERRRHGRAELRAVLRSRPFVTSFVVAFGMIWSLAAVRNTLLPLFTDAELGFSSAAVGLTLTVVTAGALAALVPAGRLIDRVGRRPVVRWATLAMAAGTGLLAMTTTIWALVPVAMLVEASRSALSPVQVSVVSDIASETTRATSIGISRLSNALGSATGPVMAGWFVDMGGTRQAFLLAAGFLGAIALAARALPETSPARSAPSRSRPGKTP